MRLIVALILVATGFWSDAARAAECKADSRLATILKRGKLIVGVPFDYPPTGYVDKDGKNVGFAPDIAREFAKHLGVTLELVQSKVATKIPMIQNGIVDMDIGTTTPTKARSEVVDFSWIYVWDRSVIMVRSGMSKSPTDYYGDSKAVIGGVQGTRYVSIWREKAPKANVVLFQEYPDLVVALAQRKVDVALISEIAAARIMESLGDRAKDLVIGDAYVADAQAIIVPQNDSKLRNWVNWALQRLWVEGTFKKLYKEAFRVAPPFELGENGQLQQGVEKVASDCDPW